MRFLLTLRPGWQVGIGWLLFVIGCSAIGRGLGLMERLSHSDVSGFESLWVGVQTIIALGLGVVAGLMSCVLIPSGTWRSTTAIKPEVLGLTCLVIVSGLQLVLGFYVGVFALFASYFEGAGHVM